MPGQTALHRINLVKSDAAYRVAASAWGGPPPSLPPTDAALVSAILTHTCDSAHKRECPLLDVVAFERRPGEAGQENAADDAQVVWSRSLARKGDAASGAALVWEVQSSRARIRGLLSDVVASVFDGTKEIAGVWLLLPQPGGALKARIGVRDVSAAAAAASPSHPPRRRPLLPLPSWGDDDEGDEGDEDDDKGGGSGGLTLMNLLATAAAEATPAASPALRLHGAAGPSDRKRPRHQSVGDGDDSASGSGELTREQEAPVPTAAAAAAAGAPQPATTDRELTAGQLRAIRSHVVDVEDRVIDVVTRGRSIIAASLRYLGELGALSRANLLAARAAHIALGDVRRDVDALKRWVHDVRDPAGAEVVRKLSDHVQQRADVVRDTAQRLYAAGRAHRASLEARMPADVRETIALWEDRQAAAEDDANEDDDDPTSSP